MLVEGMEQIHHHLASLVTGLFAQSNEWVRYLTIVFIVLICYSNYQAGDPACIIL